MNSWPHDDEQSLIDFYGDPREPGWAHANLTRIDAPWQLYYAGKPYRGGITIHRKCARAFEAALKNVWAKANQDENTIRMWGVHNFSGCYNPRPVRGTENWEHPKMSIHYFAAAIDWDAGNEGLNTDGHMARQVIDAHTMQGIIWGGTFSRRDPMHFQAAYEGRPQRVADVNLNPPFKDDTNAPMDDAPAVLPRPDPRDRLPQPDVDDEPKPKSMFRSKIAWVQTTLAGLGIGGAGFHMDGIGSVITKAAEKPEFWFFLTVVVVAAVTIYFRWNDHGRQ